jgi:hypothetical protein
MVEVLLRECLFHINKEYFEQMIPLLEHHQMKMTWTTPYYFSITHYTPNLEICYKMPSKLGGYDYNTASKIISMYDDSRIKVDAYLGLALRFQETHLNDALAEEELKLLLKSDALFYSEYGINVARFHLAFDHQKKTRGKHFKYGMRFIYTLFKTWGFTWDHSRKKTLEFIQARSNRRDAQELMMVAKMIIFRVGAQYV